MNWYIGSHVSIIKTVKDPNVIIEAARCFFLTAPAFVQKIPTKAEVKR